MGKRVPDQHRDQEKRNSVRERKRERAEEHHKQEQEIEAIRQAQEREREQAHERERELQCLLSGAERQRQTEIAAHKFTSTELDRHSKDIMDLQVAHSQLQRTYYSEQSTFQHKQQGLSIRPKYYSTCRQGAA